VFRLRFQPHQNDAAPTLKHCFTYLFFFNEFREERQIKIERGTTDKDRERKKRQTNIYRGQTDKD
jgi:hypothetical protein